MTSVITSAAAIVAAAQLNDLIADYKAAISMPPLDAYTCAHNPLRSITTLMACVACRPHAVGGGMCEFEIVARAGHRYTRLRCIAPAYIAIHIRAQDMVRLTGTAIKRNKAAFFGVESIRGAEY
ncbi:MAG TPA: hypothetical protein VFE17_07300 [Candidatus Baltobacteraceae bacterium]|nr:hypothetical protein [Candidatus Baltobacteraceae bacterium]